MAWTDPIRAVFSHPRFLPMYAGALTLVFALTVLTGAGGRSGHATFDEIDVQRINIREPDGQLRLVIADNARFPGAIVFGKELPHPDRKADHTAGLLFFDGEGSESGGLIFGGQRDADGVVQRYGHLSFDKYDQDQLMALGAQQSGAKRSASIAFNDQPDWSLAEMLEKERDWQRLPAAERHQAERDYMQARGTAQRRVWLGRADDAASVLDLRDAQGRTRLTARVTADGTPSLQVLDADGRVTDQWPKPAP